MNKFILLESWIERLCKLQSYSEIVQTMIDSSTSDRGIEKKKQYRLFTKEYIYCIVAVESLEHSYLGCIVMSRKPKVGEEWGKGKALADGKFEHMTWIRILEDIIAYELTPIPETILLEKEKVGEKR